MDRNKLQEAPRKSKIKVTIEYGEFDEDEFDFVKTFPADKVLMALIGKFNQSISMKSMGNDGKHLSLAELFRVWIYAMGGALSVHPGLHKEIRRAVKMTMDHMETLEDILEGSHKYYPEQVSLTGKWFSSN